MMPVRFLLCLAAAIPLLRADDDPLRTLQAGHPRLLVTGTDTWTRLRAQRQTDPALAAVLDRIDSEARALLAAPPVERRLTGRRLLLVSRTVLERTLVLAFAHQMTGNPAFAERAERELLAAAAFSDWNPSHFLDVGEMTAALALGYDWLYAQLSPEARTAIRRAIVEKGLALARDPAGPYTVWQRAENNWVQVCWGGMTLGALAVADDEPELARAILRGAHAGIGRGLKPYAPDGVYPEGPSYWGYGTTYQVLMIAALESALGTDWDLSASPGFLASAGALLQMTGPSGRLFNFSDGREPGALQPALFWFAARLHNPGLLQEQKRYLGPAPRAVQEGEAHRETVRFLPLAALWWPGSPAFDTVSTLPRFWCGRGTNPIAVFRSSWTDPNALYLAVKGGAADLSHAHMDAGSFVLETDGVRWAVDLGMQEYESLESKQIDLWNRAQDSQRWQVFRLNNRSHNTLTIDDRLHRVAGAARIVGFSDRGEEPFAVIDLTPVFAGEVTRAERRFEFGPGRTVRIRDTLAGLAPGAAVRWTLATRAHVELAGTAATLRQDGQMLSAALHAPAGAVFAAIPAAPPPDDFNAPNPGVQLLLVQTTAPASGELTIEVELQPGAARKR